MHPVFLFIMDIFYLLMRSISSSRSILSFSFSCILLRQVIGDYQRLAYIINDYQGVHFERLSF